VDRVLMNPMKLVFRMWLKEVLLGLLLEVFNILWVGDCVSVHEIQIFS
jgi:hypothetical protein